MVDGRVLELGNIFFLWNLHILMFFQFEYGL